MVEFREGMTQRRDLVMGGIVTMIAKKKVQGFKVNDVDHVSKDLLLDSRMLSTVFKWIAYQRDRPGAISWFVRETDTGMIPWIVLPDAETTKIVGCARNDPYKFPRSFALDQPIPVHVPRAPHVEVPPPPPPQFHPPMDFTQRLDSIVTGQQAILERMGTMSLDFSQRFDDLGFRMHGLEQAQDSIIREQQSLHTGFNNLWSNLYPGTSDPFYAPAPPSWEQYSGPLYGAEMDHRPTWAASSVTPSYDHSIIGDWDDFLPPHYRSHGSDHHMPDAPTGDE